jgi:thiamine-phosphate pyrophosphorylase
MGGDGSRGPMRRDLLRNGRGLYLILSRPRIPHIDLAMAACDRDVPIIQLREKDMDDGALLDVAREIAGVARGTRTLFIMNDRPDLAARAGADGVHLGKSDVDYEEARELLGADAIVGLSSRTPGEARAAAGTGADYIGIGPVFPTATKPDARNPVGIAGLIEAVAAAPGLPAVAIGGIGSHNVSDVLAAGAAYAAVISAICHAADPVVAMDEFLSAMK